MAPCPRYANTWASRVPTRHASSRPFPDSSEPDVPGRTGMPDGAIVLPAAPGGRSASMWASTLSDHGTSESCGTCPIHPLLCNAAASTACRHDGA